MKKFLLLIVLSVFSVSIFASNVEEYSVKLDDVAVSATATLDSVTNELEKLELTFTTDINADVKREIKYSRTVGGDAELTITDTKNGNKNIFFVTWKNLSPAGTAPDFSETASYWYHPEGAYKANQGHEITFTGTDLRNALTILYGYHEAHGKVSADVWQKFLTNIKNILTKAVNTKNEDFS